MNALLSRGLLAVCNRSCSLNIVVRMDRAWKWHAALLQLCGERARAEGAFQARVETVRTLEIRA